MFDVEGGKFIVGFYLVTNLSMLHLLQVKANPWTMRSRSNIIL